MHFRVPMAPHAPPRAKPQSTASTAFPQLALPTKAAAPNRVKQTRRSKNNPRTPEEQAAYDRARRESKTNHMRHVRTAFQQQITLLFIHPKPSKAP